MVTCRSIILNLDGNEVNAIIIGRGNQEITNPRREKS
jgi:hypothetical protein